MDISAALPMYMNRLTHKMFGCRFASCSTRLNLLRKPVETRLSFCDSPLVPSGNLSSPIWPCQAIGSYNIPAWPWLYPTAGSHSSRTWLYPTTGSNSSRTCTCSANLNSYRHIPRQASTTCLIHNLLASDPPSKADNAQYTD